MVLRLFVGTPQRIGYESVVMKNILEFYCSRNVQQYTRDSVASILGVQQVLGTSISAFLP
jgi:hypothetical protein